MKGRRSLWILMPVMLGLSTLLSAALLGSCGGSPEGSESIAEATSESAAPPVAITPELLTHGRELYTMNCAPCHGAQGRGDGPASSSLDPKPRDHTNGEYMDSLTDKDIAETVKYGGVMKRMPQMPGFPEMKETDLDALVAFVRSLSDLEAQEGESRVGG